MVGYGRCIGFNASNNDLTVCTWGSFRSPQRDPQFVAVNRATDDARKYLFGLGLLLFIMRKIEWIGRELHGTRDG